MKSIEEALAALRAAGAPDAPAEIERRVLAAFDARRRRSFHWGMTAAVTAAIALAIVAVAIRRAASPPQAVDAPFIEIPYVAPFAPYERISVKRMEVPVAALIAAGFEIDAADTGASMPADVLFGQDGRAHAIRLIQKTGRTIDR